MRAEGYGCEALDVGAAKLHRWNASRTWERWPSVRRQHVVAHARLGAAVQRYLDDSGVWPPIGGCCHLARDTV